MNEDDMHEAAESAALEVLMAKNREGRATLETHAKAIAAAVVAAFATIQVVEVGADDVLGMLLGVESDGEEPS